MFFLGYIAIPFIILATLLCLSIKLKTLLVDDPESHDIIEVCEDGRG
jgi:hypothetical protein